MADNNVNTTSNTDPGVVDPTTNTSGNGEPNTATTEQNKLSIDNVINYLNANKDAKKKILEEYFQSDVDRRVTQSLENWKKNNLEGIVTERTNDYVSKHFPQETQEQRELRELKNAREQDKKEVEREKLKTKGINYANSFNFGIGEHIDWITGGSEEETRNRLDWLKELRESAKREGRNEVISQHARTPQSGSDNGGITLDNVKQRYEEAKRKYGLNALAKDPELKKFIDANAGKIKL